ncbi:MAG: hypothetical protein PSV18_14090 [Methylobacter sp.]|uniref:Uncharacterized protein n=1 Tax=Candidatus Methylobacter titanis TaxID=3053457 RepID=A0AA43Q6V6_9GAMM|nr:hypothetical protein [Candidatus Methylobacter titanis]MDI1293859.1 hypothetical protein [Candidatus Methylobacter titanis]
MKEQYAGVSEKYNAAIKKIEWLEGELNQKKQALNQIGKAQSIMSEGIKNCAASLCTTQAQLQAIAAHLNHSNKRIFELIQKNRALKSSGDEWLRRSIKLEFEVLMAKDTLKKVENERDSAVQMYELFQAGLMSNNQSRKQG